MEAKVLRAALSAAIRVTVSTSLLGCGGVTTGGQGEEPVGSGPPAKQDQHHGVEAPSTGDSEGSGYNSSSSSGSGGYAASASVGTAGVSPDVASSGSGGLATGSGGAAVAGAAAGGQSPAGGGSGSAGGCDEVVACVTELQGVLAGDAWQLEKTPRNLACCDRLLGDRFAALAIGPECASLVDPTADHLFWPCCAVLDSPSDRGCTPWGPPVPPELDLERSIAWAAA